MNQAANPLDQLRDIHLPPAIDTFELAYGWWIVIGLLLIAGLLALYQWKQRLHARRYLKPALVELEHISKLSPKSENLQILSALLKRVCLLYFPKHEFAAVAGKEWFEYLNHKAGDSIYDAQQLNMVEQLLYRKDAEIELNQWHELIKQSKKAIVQLIENGILNNSGEKLS
ncbi:MAG: DUF4381 domain-containing protein [Gammaproteobacteria bacterium]|nr:DUF4381 domain-containing protein [Gammaproteobacteria bacterium]